MPPASEYQHQHPDGRPTHQQPKWRRDFPIETSEDEYVSRRDFAKFLVLTSAAMAAGQISVVAQSAARQGRDPHEPMPIVRDDEVGVGGVVRFEYPERGDPCLLARLDDGKVIAFGQKCTHLQCAVSPDVESKRFICPCHKGYFDMVTGRPLAGPPRRPLPRIVLEVRDDGMIYATGVELQT